MKSNISGYEVIIQKVYIVIVNLYYPEYFLPSFQDITRGSGEKKKTHSYGIVYINPDQTFRNFRSLKFHRYSNIMCFRIFDLRILRLCNSKHTV